MGSPYANAHAADGLLSGVMFHRSVGGAWDEVTVTLRHTFLEVVANKNSRSSGPARTNMRDERREYTDPLDRELLSPESGVVIHWADPPPGIGGGKFRAGALGEIGGDDDDDGTVVPPAAVPRPLPSRRVLARVLLHMCHVEPVQSELGHGSTDGAFSVASAAGSGSRVVLRPRFGDTHVRAQWMEAVRAARDALPPIEITTPGHIPKGFDGWLRYTGWVRLIHGTSAVKGVPLGATVVLAVSDHDIRLMQGVPRKSEDLDKRCALRLPLVSCRLEPPPELRGAVADSSEPPGSFTVVCSNGASFTLHSGKRRHTFLLLLISSSCLMIWCLFFLSFRHFQWLLSSDSPPL